ncbi:MAG: winged helix-turn-helix domain-containing protein [Candidatus Micrarchaeota archaeon]
MKLTKRETEILDFLLVKSATTAEIASGLAIKKSNLSRYLKKLADYSLIETKKEKRSKIISINPFISSGFVSVRSNFPSLKLSDILVGRMPSFLSFLWRRGRFRLIDIDLPAITSKRLLKKMRSIGLVHMEKKGEYELRNEALPIAEFCFSSLTALEGIKFSKDCGSAITGQSSIESAKGIEVVYTSEKEARTKKYRLTAFSMFDKYGVHLLSAGKFYYTNIKPGIADVVIHTLALSRDERNISYVCALMLKNSFNPKKLLAKRQLFSLGKKFINEIIKFIESKGKKTFPGFPTWEEVEGVAYGR